MDKMAVCQECGNVLYLGSADWLISCRCGSKRVKFNSDARVYTDPLAQYYESEDNIDDY